MAATDERRVQVRWGDAEAVMEAGIGLPEFVSVEGTITLAERPGESSVGSPGESSVGN